jgi:hypothetical protein
MKIYDFVLEGTGRDSTGWKCEGTVGCESINVLMDTIMKETFMALTSGKSVYGDPGKGCKGPYNILRVVIEQRPGEDHAWN